MKKAVIVILLAAGICGAGYFGISQGYVDSYFPGLLPKIIPGYVPASSAAGDGRVSSTAENAVYVDKVENIAYLGQGSGVLQRFAGKVEPQETKDFNADSDRTIEETFVEVGDEVKVGQKLFSYDTSEEEDKLEQDRIDLERLRSSVDTSEARKEKLEQELEQADTPEKKLELMTARNEIKQNELDQKSKEKEIESLEAKIQNAFVSSDIEGAVKSVGENSQSSSYGSSQNSAYITIVKFGTYRVKAEVNEQNISQVSTGMRVLVHSRMDPSIIWRGQISVIQTDQGSDSNSNDYYYYGNSSGSTSYPFYVELDDSEGLMLGQHVYVEEDLGQEDTREGLWLDDYYIATDGEGNTFVWTASKANLLEKRMVITGEHDEGLLSTRILSGLDASDYIAQPSQELTEGLPVNYNDPSHAEESTYIYLETEDFDFSDEAYELASEDFDFFGDDDDFDDFYFDDEDDVLKDGEISGLDFSDEDLSGALSSAMNLFNGDVSFENQSGTRDMGEDADLSAGQSLDEGTGGFVGTGTGTASPYGSLGETGAGTVNVSDVAAGLSPDEDSQS